MKSILFAILSIYVGMPSIGHAIDVETISTVTKATKEDNAFAHLMEIKKNFDVDQLRHCATLNNICLQFILRYTYDERTPQVAMIFIETEDTVGVPPFSNNLPEFNKKIAQIVRNHPSSTKQEIRKVEHFVERAEKYKNKKEIEQAGAQN